MLVPFLYLAYVSSTLIKTNRMSIGWIEDIVMDGKVLRSTNHVVDEVAMQN